MDRGGRVTESEHPAHPAEQGVVHAAHLVMHCFHLSGNADGILRNSPRFVNRFEGLRCIGDLYILGRSSRRECVVVGGVVKSGLRL